ncbi:MAG: hypothetical protein ABI593_00840 [Betaproteobacteria bacterium]
MLPRIWTAIVKLREFERSEKMTRAEFEAQKLAKFRKLVDHAQRHSPYYADVIKAQGIDVATCVPENFPALTRAIVNEHFDRIVTDRRITRAAIDRFLEGSHDPRNLFLGAYHVIHTSGTSGASAPLVYSETDWARGMVQSLRPGWKPPRKFKFRRYRTAYYGALGGHFGGVAMIGVVKRGLLRLFSRIEMVEINDPLKSAVERLNAFSPEFVIGYVAALKVLAVEQRAGRLHIAPGTVAGGGETMTVSDRQLLEQAFNCQVRCTYGTTEHLMMGITAPGTSTMVLYDDDLHYEIRDDHCLITNLFNRTMPMIRHRLDDILRPALGPSPAPPYLAIESIIGRSELIMQFVTEDGHLEPLLPFSFLTLQVPGMVGFQIRLLDEVHFRVLIRVDAALTPQEVEVCAEEVRKGVFAILQRKRMANVGFDITVVSELPIDPRTRKLKLIVDDRTAASAPALQ